MEGYIRSCIERLSFFKMQSPMVKLYSISAIPKEIWQDFL